jgi:pyridoxal phosphate enzyme (YggS family)
MSCAEKYLHYKKEIEPTATLIAVSKGHPIESILEVYEAGCRDFGESRVQEALEKIKACPKDIRWHLIGTLQTKKVPKIIGHFHLIHSVDTPDLVKKISQCSVKEGKITRILLQANTSGETSKHGCTINEWKNVLSDIINLPCIEIFGLMTMAPHTEDLNIIKNTFSMLKAFKNEVFKENPLFCQLSMGMTDDYKIALAEGATYIRIGSGIFT